jgi:uncharacterized membrane protein
MITKKVVIIDIVLLLIIIILGFVLLSPNILNPLTGKSIFDTTKPFSTGEVFFIVLLVIIILILFGIIFLVTRLQSTLQSKASQNS